MQKLRFISLLAFIAFGIIGSIITAQATFANSANSITSTLCAVYKLVHSSIFLLGLVLMTLGAALYAGANLAPSQPKGTIQAYGMGMIVGGVTGVIIALISPFLLGILTGNTAIASGCV